MIERALASSDVRDRSAASRPEHGDNHRLPSGIRLVVLDRMILGLLAVTVLVAFVVLALWLVGL